MKRHLSFTKISHLFFLMATLLFLLSCQQKSKDISEEKLYNTIEKKEALVLLNEEGDTIPTGVPIPIQGMWVNPDSVSKPKIVPLKKQPEKIPAHPNVHPAGKPKIVPIPKKLTVITPGENGVPFSEVVPAKGKVIPALWSEPVPALPMRFKDNAIVDIQYLDVDQGMLSSYVYAILEDSRGFLWFGTYEGLSRFDGKKFTHFTSDNGLNDNWIQTIFEDSQNNLWLGTFKGGLTKFDGKYFTHYTTQEGFSNNGVNVIFEDSQSNIWIGKRGQGVSCFDGKNFTHFNTEHGLINYTIRDIFEGKKGQIWLATYQGVCRYDGTSFTHFTTKEGLSANNIQSIMEDNQGNLWFGTYYGLSRYDGEYFYQFTTAQGLNDNGIKSLLEDKQGGIWIGTERGGISRFDSKSFTHYKLDEGLNTNNVTSIFQDKQENIWVGTNGGGICKFDANGFSYFNVNREDDGLYGGLINDRQGNLWFGSGNGICRYSGKDLEYFTKREGLKKDFMRPIIADRNGNFWLALYNFGLCKFDGNNFIYYSTEEGLRGYPIRTMMEDSNGNLWLGTEGGGLSVFDGKSFTHFTTKEGLTNNNIYALLEDRKSNIWIGTLGGGASCFDGKNIIHYTSKEGLSHNSVFAITEDSQGLLWFGTEGGGLSSYDGVHFQSYKIGGGLSQNMITSIIEVGNQDLWVASQKGLHLFSPNRKESSYLVHSFYKEDGVKTLNFEQATCLDNNNKLWWMSGEGPTILDLNRFKLAQTVPRITMNTIKIQQDFIDFRRLAYTSYQNTFSFGKDLYHSFDSVASFYNYPLGLNLPHYINHLTFHFSAIDWAAPHKLQYSYLMEGIDENWSTPKAESFADYRNLPNGDYIFKVKAIGEAQKWSEVLAYSFTIRPPWWRSWSAFAFYGLIFAAFWYGLYRFLLDRQLEKVEAERLRELNQTKSRLYTNITHEFRTPLTIILGMADQIRQNPKNWFVEGLQLIKRNGSQLLHLVNQMLDLARLETGSLPLHLEQDNVVQYLNYIVESFHSYAESQSIELHFLSEKSEIIMDYDADKLLNIVSNLLSNAIKFTNDGGNVYMMVDEIGIEETSFLQIKVKDSGIGIAAEKLPHIFDRFYQADDSSTRKGEGTGVGLALTKELVQLFNGKIEVSSELKKGTIFTILLPITKSAPLSQAGNGVTLDKNLDLFITKSHSDAAIPSVSTSIGNLPLLLIVEDNPDVVQYITSCLQDNYQLIAAQNGQEGINKAIEHIPDLIISDVMMPEKDGFELCETLKNDERTSHIPIIMLTAKVDIESRLVGLTRGADAYLAKPFNSTELNIRIQKLIELRRQLQERYKGQSDLQPSENIVLQVEDIFIKKVRAIVEENYTNPKFGNAQLCRLLFLERTQVYRKLKALTGQSATAFIRSYRLHKAKELLQNPEMNITQIAFEVGFNDLTYFSKMFKGEFGESPSEVKLKR